MDELARRPKRGPAHATMQHLLTDMQNHPSSWAFQNPVNKEEVTDYYDVIKQPMDLSTMEYKLDNNLYHTLDAFVIDALLVFRNCRSYNPEGSTYYKNASKLEKHLREKLEEWAPEWREEIVEAPPPVIVIEE